MSSLQNSKGEFGDVSISYTSPSIPLPLSSSPHSPRGSPSTSLSSSYTPSSPSRHYDPSSSSSSPPPVSYPPSSFRATSSSLVTPVNPKLYHSSAYRAPKTDLPPLPPPPPTSPIKPNSDKSQNLHLPSLLCVMTLGFFANIEYGVIMPSIWKYTSSLHGTEMQMGMAIAFCSAAQVVFLPIFGWWSDKRTMKEVFVISLIVGIIGNVVYASAQYFGSPWLIIGGRTLIGVYSGVNAVNNSFIASVTTPQTRTRFMAHMNGVNALGLVTGPAFNLFLAKADFTILPNLRIDALTSPAWFVGALLCISVLVFLIVFREPASHAEVIDEEAPLNSSSSSLPPAKTSSSSNSLSLSNSLSFILHSFKKPWGVCFLINFVQNFDFSVLETCVTLYTTPIYNFTPFQNSLMYSAMSVEMIIIIILTAVVSKWISDRVIIVFGMAFMGAGVTLLLVGFNYHSPFYMLVIIIVVLLVGLPSQNTAVMSCYSKLIDQNFPKAKQGLYSGVMMVFGSSARIVGPLWGGFSTGLKHNSIKINASLLVAMFSLELVVTLIFFRKLKVIEKRPNYSINQEQTPLINHNYEG